MRPSGHPLRAPASGRVLALDVGERRIGLAISDPDGRVAVPLETLERRNEDADLQALADLVEREGVQAVVVGLPLSLDGSVGRQAQLTQEFARRLAEAVSVPVEMWDERLSSVAAERALMPPGASDRQERRRPRVGERRRPPRRREGAQDALAATFILQSYLDSRRQPPASGQE
jgi:putative Holliday junction resolvase